MIRHRVIVKKGCVRYTNRNIWSPRVIFTASKLASRGIIAAGGTIIAGASYTAYQFQTWTQEKQAQLKEFLKSFSLPQFSFEDIPMKSPSSFGSVVNAASSRVDDLNKAKNNFSEQLSSYSVFGSLTKRLLEVRAILKSVDNTGALFKLPSLVVIGSQSSGKSSLLEMIVGQSFLPKGNNMVTRRPIEITLVNKPNLKESYAEFPRQGIKNISDFSQVGKIISELNLSVSEEECVSVEPIELFVYSSSVPDLQLVDLPGYIAVNSKDQPLELKQKIVQLCRQYLKAPNIILAVSAADVDLANSEALNEARNADPLGKRTIGVLTKMDLISVQKGESLLNNDQYHLKLGYFGVVCKYSKDNDTAVSENFKKIISFEKEKFLPFKEKYKSNVGTPNLLKALVTILESNMAQSLGSVVQEVRKELDDTRYKFKVMFNDRHISPEGYALDVLDQLKEKLRSSFKEFNRSKLRSEVLSFLDARMLMCLEQVYLSDDNFEKMSKSLNTWNDDDRVYWRSRFEKANALLTTAGLGRMTTEKLVQDVESTISKVLNQKPFNFHKKAIEDIQGITNELLRSKIYQTADQVENSLKPFKFEVDFSSSEWLSSLRRVIGILSKEKIHIANEVEKVKNEVGPKKLRNAMQYISTLKDQNSSTESKNIEPVQVPFNSKVLISAQKAFDLQNKLDKLQKRINFLQPNWLGIQINCSYESVTNEVNHNSNCIYACPEPYLALISEKLSHTSVMFIWIELLNDFFYQLPKEIDQRLYYNPSKQDIIAFSQENPEIKAHLELQEKKVALSHAMEKLLAIQHELV